MAKSLHVLKPIYPVDEIIKNITSSLDSGWTGDGGMTETFEKEWSIYTGYKHSIYVNSCTAALHLSLLALKDKFPNKTKVIVPNITFVSSAAVVLQTSLDLTLCDVDESLCLEVSSLKKIIDKETLAVVFVGIGGNTNNLSRIKEICELENVSLIIDAAHMSGSKLAANSNPKLGDFADFICYSFQAVKNLGIADSGMLCTQKDELLDDILKYRWLGINKTTYQRSIEKNNSYKWEYQIDRLGYKYNGNALIASCCLSLLPSLDKSNSYRRKLRNRYQEKLKDLKDINFIYHENEEFTSAHLSQILLKDGITSNQRNIIISKLNRYNIFPGVHYTALSEFKYYRTYSNQICKSKQISDRIISLPCHLDIEFEDVDFIVSSLIEILT